MKYKLFYTHSCGIKRTLVETPGYGRWFAWEDDNTYPIARLSEGEAKAMCMGGSLKLCCEPIMEYGQELIDFSEC